MHNFWSYQAHCGSTALLRSIAPTQQGTSHTLSGGLRLALSHTIKPMPASRKKVIVRKLSRDWLAGYLPPAGFVAEQQVQMLDLAGKLVAIAVADVKWICFVKDFQSGDAAQPERLLRRTYVTRPRTQGLWVRIRCIDNDVLEGLVQNDLTLLEGDGLFLIPPDTRSNTQRIFVPRPAVAELEVLSVIRTQGRRPASDAVQESLFKPQNSAG